LKQKQVPSRLCTNFCNRSIENHASLVIVEHWDNVESHKQAASAIQPEKLKDAFTLFAKPPAGVYYSE
jgi:hypothetical protein